MSERLPDRRFAQRLKRLSVCLNSDHLRFMVFE